MTRSIRFFLILVVYCLALSSCEGDPGPVGLEGDTGETGSSGQPGRDGAKGDPGMIWQGAWNATTNYEASDVVQHLGSSYVCLVPNINQQPPSANWDLLASKGSDVDWNGGTVSNPSTFEATATFNALVELNAGATLDPGQALLWKRSGGSSIVNLNSGGLSFQPGGNKLFDLDVAEGTETELELFGSGSNSKIEMDARPDGTSALYLSSNSVSQAVIIEADQSDGGCGRISLKNASGIITLSFNGCTGLLQVRNARGEITFALDGETGNVFYSGSLMKR